MISVVLCYRQVVFQKGAAQKPTATIQLAKDNLVYVFHLPSCTAGSGSRQRKLPKELQALLTDKHIKKVGLNIKGDGKKLHRDFGIQLAGAIELQEMGDAAFPDHGQGKWSLQLLTYWVLRKHLSKDARVRFCDWESRKLTAEQVEYAAADALAGLLIFRALSPPNMPPKPPSSAEQGRLLSREDVNFQVREFLDIQETEGPGNVERIAHFPHQFSSRIKLDPFHLLQRYGRSLNSRSDPLVGVFMSMMRDALFVTNKEDEKMLRAYLESRGASKDDVKRMSRSYFINRVRRSIPPPAILAARLQNVYDLFSDAVMTNGKPLYRKQTKGERPCCTNPGPPKLQENTAIKIS